MRWTGGAARRRDASGTVPLKTRLRARSERHGAASRAGPVLLSSPAPVPGDAGETQLRPPGRDPLRPRSPRPRRAAPAPRARKPRPGAPRENGDPAGPGTDPPPGNVPVPVPLTRCGVPVPPVRGVGSLYPYPGCGVPFSRCGVPLPQPSGDRHPRSSPRRGSPVSAPVLPTPRRGDTDPLCPGCPGRGRGDTAGTAPPQSCPIPGEPIPGRRDSPSWGAASLPLLPPDGSGTALPLPAGGGPAAGVPFIPAATSSRSRRWLTLKFFRL